MKVAVADVEPTSVPTLTNGETTSCDCGVGLVSVSQIPANLDTKHLFELSDCSEKADLPQSQKSPDPIPMELLKIPIASSLFA